MPTSYTITGVLVLGLYLAIMVFKWLSDKSAEKKKVNDDEKKKISDDVNSDDLGRFNDTVDKLRT